MDRPGFGRAKDAVETADRGGIQGEAAIFIECRGRWKIPQTSY